MHSELSPLIVWIAVWIVNTYSKFQVNIFSNNRDIAKCQRFCKSMTTLRLKQYLGFSPKTDELRMLVTSIFSLFPRYFLLCQIEPNFINHQQILSIWTSLPFTCKQYKSSENLIVKGEIARNKQFLLFPVFSTSLKNFLPFSSNLKLSSAANSLSLAV